MRGVWAALLIALLLGGQALAQPAEKVGAGTLWLAPKGKDQPPPAAPGRTEALMHQAAPTSQWYSTLAFNPKPEAIFVQPITVKATPAGLEFALPTKEAVARA